MDEDLNETIFPHANTNVFPETATLLSMLPLPAPPPPPPPPPSLVSQELPRC